MPDEVTTGELARRLDDIQRLLTGVVGHPEYAADKRGLDYRFGEVKADIEDLRRVHADDVRELHARISEQARAGVEHRMHWRSLLLTGVFPALMTGLGVLVAWLVAHGGH